MKFDCLKAIIKFIILVKNMIFQNLKKFNIKHKIRNTKKNRKEVVKSITSMYKIIKYLKYFYFKF